MATQIENFQGNGSDADYEGRIEVLQFNNFIGFNAYDYGGERAKVNLDPDKAEAFANKILEYVAEARR